MCVSLICSLAHPGADGRPVVPRRSQVSLQESPHHHGAGAGPGGTSRSISKYTQPAMVTTVCGIFCSAVHAYFCTNTLCFSVFWKMYMLTLFDS